MKSPCQRYCIVSAFGEMWPNRFRTGIDLSALIETAQLCEQTLGRELLGRVTRSGLSPLLLH